MLNSPAPIANNPLAALATLPAPGPATAGADDGPGFAQALDQASARQRDAVGDGADASGRDKPSPKAEAATRKRADAAEVRRPGGTHGTHATHGTRAAHGGHDPHGPDGPRGAAKGLADAGAETGSAICAEIGAEAEGDDRTRPTGEATPVPPATNVADLAAQPDAAQPQPADLAAWVSSLALPRPAAAALATPAATRAEPIARAAAADPAATTTAPDDRSGTTPGTDPTTPSPAFAALIAHDPGRHAEVRSIGADHGPQALAGPRETLPAQRPGSDSGNALPARPGVWATALPRQADASPPAQIELQALAVPRETLPVQRPGSDNGIALPALPSTWAPALPRPLDASSPAQAELRAPVGSAEFAPSLSSQLSVWVRDGIDHAQLKLNPAAMGPIEVRISLDGTQAQVDFSAAHAATRQALQDAVPALAGALRESGLTLTGGGVFEQAREQRGDTRQDGSRQTGGEHRRPLDSAAAPLPAARLARARGVVDLYA